jgi:hypothetical protein
VGEEVKSNKWSVVTLTSCFQITHCFKTFTTEHLHKIYLCRWKTESGAKVQASDKKSKNLYDEWKKKSKKDSERKHGADEDRYEFHNEEKQDNRKGRGGGRGRGRGRGRGEGLSSGRGGAQEAKRELKTPDEIRKARKLSSQKKARHQRGGKGGGGRGARGKH